MEETKIRRLYFGVRYLIGGLMSNLIVLSFIAFMGKIYFTQAIIIIPIAIVISFVTCTHINQRIMRITKMISIHLNHHPKAKKIIFRLI